ncbi:MAG: hypothetical protein KJ884_05530 [Gammaproteobacteria bacterium]|uniref:YqjK-like protein n=1 Tax=Pseudomonas cuatrocienegasensis TaxID=543360 RepID=A0ABY1BAR3_9PSED|nr:MULTISPECIES: hypothetical protein [Pseudomonas]MBU1329394.1 hypothetical protein [Gammaproteobacteria bacterium]MBU1491313.1 hypothetical protein [Gammaproteobacteria bacterium]MBU2067904.1 hypothetical protein [Gammaproteobacteria bacterium]MBU2138367.1 hypothetical protein [Gammaproteobacteria bacterium]MBU2218336.1 hypothetical protein [Gammaproteobacteria bacterium]
MTDLVPLTPAEQRKELLRLQLELRRQQIRLETLIVMQPLRKVQRFRNQCRSELQQGNAKLMIAGGGLLIGLLGARKVRWRGLLRLALLAAPVVRQVAAQRAKARRVARNGRDFA